MGHQTAAAGHGAATAEQGAAGPPRSPWRVAVTVLAVSLLLRSPDAGAQDPPFSIRQEPAVAVAGGEVTLRLLPVPEGFVICTWYRGSGTDADFEVLSIFADPSLGTLPGPAFSGRESVDRDCALRVTSLTPDDTGNYTAAVRHPQLDTASATLRVYLPLPQPAVTPAEVTAVENETATLTCHSPPGTDLVTWLRDGTPVAAAGSLSLSPDNRTVRLQPVRRGDGGSYVCEVANAAGANRSEATNVTVLYGPDSVAITPRGPLHLRRGTRLELLCSAAAFPPPRFSWSHQNVTLATGPLLALTLGDPGHYWCQATNLALGTGAQASVLLLEEQGLPSGAIAGIVVGALLALGLLLATGYGLWSCVARSSSSTPLSGPKPSAPPGGGGQIPEPDLQWPRAARSPPPPPGGRRLRRGQKGGAGGSPPGCTRGKIKEPAPLMEELPVDLRTRRGVPPEASLPLRKRRSAMRGALGTPPEQSPPLEHAPSPRKAPRLAPPPPPPVPPSPAFCGPPGSGLGFAPPPAAFFSGLTAELPLPLLGGPRSGVGDPSLGGPRPPAPSPLVVLGPPETQLAADIAAATEQDEDGDTALHIAVAQGALGVTRRLIGLFLRGGRDLDVYNQLQQTPLHLAVITGQPALVRLLVAHGASPRARDRLGRSGAHLACESRSPRCLRELLRPGPRGGPDLQAPNYEGLTPLHVAVGSGSRDCVLLLLEHGADIDAVDIKSGRSPLLHAVESNSLEMVELLLQRGASVNAQSYAGCSALHAAAGRGLPGILRLLLRSGADCGLRNGQHETALGLASSREVIDILRGRSSRPPQALPAPSPAPSGQAPGHRPQTPSAANQRAEPEEPANGAQGPQVTQEAGARGQPVGRAGGPALAQPLVDAPLDPACCYPMALPCQEAAANPVAARLAPQPMGPRDPPTANQGSPQGAQMDQSRTLVGEGNSCPELPPRCRLREGRGQVGGAR
ncbi:LOW QUALITY PROTEIN: uncharacterized protein [Melanerpes formicivorus]|uniref:LOW QUALITY PROTEIN: uncharacterized protein n=1 Tax=Melanerpes formicivorus TaxID=211600 RepID=UPI00358E8436